MSISATILLYGRDAMLLETRQWLLERSGYRVLAATEFAEVERTMAEERVDLLILCHSLPAVDTERALAAVAARKDKIHTLIMAAYSGRRADGVTDEVLEAMDGPASLVAVVGKLIKLPSAPQTLS